MRRLFGHWWQAFLTGILVGVPVGIALEFARRWWTARTLKRMADQFESKGESPPLIIDFLQPWAVPLLTVIVFALLALLIYVVTIRRDRVCADSVKSGAA